MKKRLLEINEHHVKQVREFYESLKTDYDRRYEDLEYLIKSENEIEKFIGNLILDPECYEKLFKTSGYWISIEDEEETGKKRGCLSIKRLDIDCYIKLNKNNTYTIYFTRPSSYILEGENDTKIDTYEINSYKELKNMLLFKIVDFRDFK